MKKNKIKLLAYLITFCSLAFSFVISVMPANSQAICSGDTVVCSDGGTPLCGTGLYPSCRNGFPQCIGGIGSGFGATSLKPECYSVCDPGYIGCPSVNPDKCCAFGCCPSNPTKCKCALNDQCFPDCSPPTYSCNSGLTICPNNTTPTAVCCQYGCCPSNPSQCKCSTSNECEPNCTVTYSCNPGLTICPNNVTPTAVCCEYGCCPSDPTKCKCQNNNQCSPNCTDQTTIGSSCTNILELIETCTAIGKIANLDNCTCIANPNDASTESTSNVNPIGLPNTNSGCSLPCTSSSQCGSGKYCNLNTKCCTVNPTNCINGCTDFTQCSSNSNCISNCCISPEPELVIIVSESKTVAVGGSRQKEYLLLNLSVTGLNFTNPNECIISVKEFNQIKRWKRKIQFQPTVFLLDTEKSTVNIKGKITMFKAITKMDNITIDVSCDGGTSVSKTVSLE